MREQQEPAEGDEDENNVGRRGVQAHSGLHSSRSVKPHAVLRPRANGSTAKTAAHSLFPRGWTATCARPHVPGIGNRATTAPVIILGYNMWQRKFNGDPRIVGKTIRISRRDTSPTVIGVMPPGIRFLPSPSNAQEPNYDVNAQVDYWIPARPSPARLKQPDWDVVGRLQSGTDLNQAQTELSVIAARQAQAD